MRIKFKSINATMVFVMSVIFSITLYANEFMGSWILADTNGEPFEILLEESGSASGTHGKDMKYGSWEEKDGKAFIYWNTGWVTIINKEGDQYKKNAFKPGESLTGKPSNTSSAKRK
jgi:hypothetical protein